MKNSEIVLATECYTPIVYGDNGLAGVNKHEYAEQLIDDLGDRIICSDNIEAHPEMENLILDFYIQAMRSCKNIPNIESVCELIEDYNSELIYQMSEIDFANDITENFTEMLEDDEIDVDETLSENYTQWHEHSYYEYNFQYILCLVNEILTKHKLSYYETPHKLMDMMSSFGLNFQFIHNDCQNLLNSEWIYNSGVVKYLDGDLNTDNLQVVMK